MRVLTATDLNSPTWIKLRAHYEAELIKARAKNDGNLSAEDTARLRGRIAEIKGFLALGHDDPVPVVPSASPP